MNWRSDPPPERETRCSTGTGMAPRVCTVPLAGRRGLLDCTHADLRGVLAFYLREHSRPATRALQLCRHHPVAAAARSAAALRSGRFVLMALVCGYAFAGSATSRRAQPARHLQVPAVELRGGLEDVGTRAHGAPRARCCSVRREAVTCRAARIQVQMRHATCAFRDRPQRCGRLQSGPSLADPITRWAVVSAWDCFPCRRGPHR